jgi:hypothetical protein
MAQKSNTQPGGRYLQGGITDDKIDRLGWWERKVFPTSHTDVKLTLTAKYNRRPDLLAYDLYGKAGLQWFILQYNTISDITTFEQNLTITVPTRARLFSELLTSAPSSSRN